MPALFNNIFSGNKVLVTGHTGFKGSWLALWLHELGADVTGYALPPPTNPSLFEIIQLDKKINSIIADVRNLPTLLSVLEETQPRIAFHMAAQALVRNSYREPVETYETNIMGTVNVLEACRRTPSVKAVVIVTSDKCYENREWVWGYREGDTLGGYDPYSSSKACAELVTSAYVRSFFNTEEYREHDIGVASVRAGNVIGGGDWAEDRLVPDCMKALRKKSQVNIRHPEAVRPWQHVLVPLSGYLLLAQRLFQDGPAFNGPWNFGPDANDCKPVRWLLERISEMLENAPWTIDKGTHPHEANFLSLDCSKARSLLGWYPRWDLISGLEKTVEWYKAYFDNEDMLPITLNQIDRYQESLNGEG